MVDRITARELQELARRERLYRDDRPMPDVKGKTVILVDDGLATGATMLVAIQALRQLQPQRIVVAVPTASPETCEAMKAEADDAVCAVTPEPFYAVGAWYQDFSRPPTRRSGRCSPAATATPTARREATRRSACLCSLGASVSAIADARSRPPR